MRRRRRWWIGLLIVLQVGLLAATAAALRSTLPANPTATPDGAAQAIQTARQADEPLPTATATLAPVATATTPPPTAAACATACPTVAIPTPTTPPPTPATKPTATPEPAPDLTAASLWRWRALTAHNAMDRTFAVADSGLYRERYGKDAIFDVAFLWPMTQVLACHIGLANLPGAVISASDVRLVSEATEAYYDDSRQPPAFSSYLAPPAGWVSDRYYDDNVWLGVELMRAWQVTRDPLALKRANQIFDYLVSGWDDGGPAPGGIFWIESDSNHDRNTVTTGAGALLGLMLVEALPPGERADYVLDWAAQMYAWVYETLEDGEGLFWDHIRPDGTFDHGLYAYNQGAMIGANLGFYRLTGDALFLDRADRTALSALALHGGRWVDEQEISFNAIFFSFLVQLDATRPNPIYRARLLTYAQRIWDYGRDPETGLATTSTPLTLLDQAAMVRIFALAAAEAGR